MNNLMEADLYDYIRGDLLLEWGLLKSKLKTLKILDRKINVEDKDKLIECVVYAGGCLQSLMYRRFSSKGEVFLQGANHVEPEYFKTVLHLAIKLVRKKYHKRMNKIKLLLNGNLSKIETE